MGLSSPRTAEESKNNFSTIDAKLKGRPTSILIRYTCVDDATNRIYDVSDTVLDLLKTLTRWLGGRPTPVTQSAKQVSS